MLRRPFRPSRVALIGGIVLDSIARRMGHCSKTSSIIPTFQSLRLPRSWAFFHRKNNLAGHHGQFDDICWRLRHCPTPTDMSFIQQSINISKPPTYRDTDRANVDHAMRLDACDDIGTGAFVSHYKKTSFRNDQDVERGGYAG